MGLAPYLSLLAPKSLDAVPAPLEQHSESRTDQPSSEQQADALADTHLEHEGSHRCLVPSSSPRAWSIGDHRGDSEEIDSVSQLQGSEILNASRYSIVRSNCRKNVARLHAHTQSGTAYANPSPKLTTSSVHAAHFSSPASIPSFVSHSADIEDKFVQSTHSSLTSNLELLRLTDGMDALNAKATPPITPRTLSNDGTEASRRTTSPNDKSTGSIDPNGTSTPRSGAPVPPPKGELVVTISGARGLRPSFDPYAVCVFEWIESIAHHHKLGMPTTDEGAGGRDLSVGGLPISRTGSNIGRSMAIPMKSRQGSTTSLSDHKEFRNGTELTDPQWDHEAVLCVVRLPRLKVNC